MGRPRAGTGSRVNRPNPPDAAPPGDIGVKEVAARAGVAPSSVSRVLSGHPDVSPVMHRRVLDAAAALGYEPNLLAQGLRRGSTMTVGFVVGDISNPLLARITLGAETELRAAGYSMLLINSGNDPDLDAAHVRLLRQRRVDGLLLSLADEGSAETIDLLQRGNTPYVLIDRDRGPFPDSSAVLSDHRTGITDAVNHLAGLGHQRIALINGNPGVRPARERAAALRAACRVHPGVSGTIRSGSFTAEHGESATQALLASPGRPTAIIAGSNQILIGVLRALRQAGVTVPAGVSLVTCDDVPLCEFLDPPLSTISRDARDMGRQAARLLLDCLAGRSPRTTVLPATFRPTASCAPPRAGATQEGHD